MFTNPVFFESLQYGFQKFKQTSADIQNNTEYVLDDIQDGSLFQKLAEQYPSFMADPLSLQIAITADGFNPFKKHGGHKKKSYSPCDSYSITPLTATLLNLPLHIRTRLGALHIVGMVPGPSQADIQSYLEPLVDELLQLWFIGLDVSYTLPPVVPPSPVPPTPVPPTTNTGVTPMLPTTNTPMPPAEAAPHGQTPGPTVPTPNEVIHTYLRVMMVHLIADYRGGCPYHLSPMAKGPRFTHVGTP